MMGRLGRAFVLAATAALSFSGSAAAADPLTLDDVLGSVGRTHPGLEVAERKIDQADGKVLAAQGGFDPTLSIRTKWTPVGYYNQGQVDTLVRQPTPAWGIGAYAGYRVGWGTYPVYKGELQTLSGGEIRAGVEVPLWRNGPIDSRRAGVKRTKIQRAGARYARDATELELERAAAEAYWSWVSAGQSLRISRELLALAERRDAGLNEQAKAGAIERIKIVDNRRLVLDRMTKVVAAERKFATASLELSLFMRDAAQNPVRPGEERVPAKIPEPASPDMASLDDEVDEAVRRRPDAAALETERDAARVDVRLARNQRAPAINLQTFVAKDFGAGPAELGPVEWGAGVVLEVPLPLRKARGELRVAKAALGAVKAKTRGLQDKIGAEVRTAHVALEAAQETITLARAQLGTTEELAEAERIRFREGASDLVIVNLRELAAAEAANQEVAALAEYQRAYADFRVSTGRSPTS